MLATIVLLLSYGAVGARQPAVRSSAALPAPAAQLAAQFNLPTIDRSRIVLDIVRMVFDSPDAADPADAELRRQLNTLLAAGTPGETAPLPLDPADASGQIQQVGRLPLGDIPAGTYELRVIVR